MGKDIKPGARDDDDEEGGGRYAGGWRGCAGCWMGEAVAGGAATATLERDPPKRRLKSATRPPTPLCVGRLFMGARGWAVAGGGGGGSLLC